MLGGRVAAGNYQASGVLVVRVGVGAIFQGFHSLRLPLVLCSAYQRCRPARCFSDNDGKMFGYKVSAVIQVVCGDRRRAATMESSHVNPGQALLRPYPRA